MLALEIELLTGVYRAALPDGSGAEWPPHPERVFSAFAQAWGDGGCDPEERAALEWLEGLGAPSIEADGFEDCVERDAPTVFVPPSDQQGGELAVLPDRRGRQARSFRAAIPVSAIVRLAWTDAVPTPEHRCALDALAHRVASLGHSASLARFTFLDEGSVEQARLWRPADNGAPLRVPHEGRLSKLEYWLSRNERPRTGMTARYRAPGGRTDQELEPTKSVFGGVEDWFVFEEVGGTRPDILGFAQVAKRVRAALMELGPQPPAEIVSGHTSDGQPTKAPHLAVVPMANVGSQYSTGDLLGFAAVLPRGLDPANRTAALKALAAFSRLGQGDGASAEVRLSGDMTWRLEHAGTPSRMSLKPDRWCASAEVWASATPVLLDRFPDHGDVIEEARLIAAACRNIGLPEPIEIEIHKYSAVKGAPPAYPSRGDRRRPDWSFPKGAKFAPRARRHVVIRFADKVAGPVFLGAGRFYGLGLCLPIGSERRQ